tara:strand:+ start:229 stop:606 length:378 start_codon:yes stop_codon:yes gene_type:complete
MEEVIQIPVDNFTNTKQQDISIFLFSLIGMVLVLFAITLRNKPDNFAKRKALKEADKKRNEEARENYIKDLRADPYLNILTENYFELHKDRLRLHRVSTYQGITYHLGPKGGLYYRSSKGTRIYI